MIDMTTEPTTETLNATTTESTIDGTFQKLRELAQNLWWSWQPDIRAIFRELDPETWRLVYHNPVALLQRVPPGEIARRVRDLEMQTRINQAHRGCRATSTATRAGAWCTPAPCSPGRWPTSRPSSASTSRSPSTPGGSECWPATT